MCMDKLCIKTKLFYNSSIDTVIGLEDNGIESGVRPAWTASVIMLRV